MPDVSSSRSVESYSPSNDYDYNQSTEQAFYFIEDIVFSNGMEIEVGDVVLAYNDNVLVGAREWSGSFTDIPVMGYDGSEQTIGYCEANSSPTFKVLKSYTGEEYTVDTVLPAWHSNEIYQLSTLDVSQEMYPSQYSISKVYPNPFNPTTNINVDISADGYLSVAIYNALGQLVDVLHSGDLSAGSHSFVWDASSNPSGVYFARMEINGSTSSIKLMLLK